ncbi:LLM class flavin-dependent oxidoreductase [Aquabacter sp. CN5-332]|uniref:LLM class flavin-dependent oxidoreductase n=1 Tax=Aquabacter sp. CN5-332 TaxID=3156608 RepID=UPI0032B3F8B3
MEILWYVVNRDGRNPWDPTWARPVDQHYLQALASTIDSRGYSGALFATQPTAGLDPFVAVASLLHFAPRMRFLLAVHPSVYAPTQLVKLATTLDQASGGRLLLNIVNGHGSFAAAGVHLNHDERYARCDEFLTIYRGIMAGETVDFEGRFLTVKGAKAEFPALQRPYPPLWFGGISEVAREVAAKHIDKFLTWGEPPPETAEVIADMRRRAAKYGRKITFGIRLNLILRDTDEEAWDEAQTMLDRTSDATIAETQRKGAAQDAVSQVRQSAFHGGERPKHARDLEVYPNLWSGLGLLRNGPGIALVGGPESIAARIREYKSIGVDAFILSGNPFLEEAHRFADQVMPLLQLDASWKQGRQDPQPFTFPKAPKLDPHPNALAAAG